MEYEDDSNDKGFVDRLRQSPRTVSALIIILIVAAAIYAFSGDQAEAPETEEVAVSEEVITDEGAQTDEAAEGEEAMEGEEVAMAETAKVSPHPVNQQQLQQEASALPQAGEDVHGYVETAQAGDGITHLARRASTRWLSQNNAGYEVTNEHRIYIEDYIQNNMGTQGLNMGESHTITFELIQEAVTAAGQLNQSQLQNLTQYSSVLG